MMCCQLSVVRTHRFARSRKNAFRFLLALCASNLPNKNTIEQMQIQIAGINMSEPPLHLPTATKLHRGRWRSEHWAFRPWRFLLYLQGPGPGRIWEDSRWFACLA